MSDTTNPLFDVGGDGPRLPFDRIRAEHVRPAIDALLVDFVGRPPRVDALLERNGLTASGR